MFVRLRVKNSKADTSWSSLRSNAFFSQWLWENLNRALSGRTRVSNRARILKVTHRKSTKCTLSPRETRTISFDSNLDRSKFQSSDKPRDQRERRQRLFLPSRSRKQMFKNESVRRDVALEIESVANIFVDERARGEESVS